MIIGGGVILYVYNKPHRDVQASSVDYILEVKQLVNEYLMDARAANEKYLQEDGDSKIIAITGRVASIDEDLHQQKVVLLKETNGLAGVSCTFMRETNKNVEKLKPGDLVTIKGVIRAGAGYDEDMELYEDVILEKCDLISNKEKPVSQNNLQTKK